MSAGPRNSNGPKPGGSSESDSQRCQVRAMPGSGPKHGGAGRKAPPSPGVVVLTAGATCPASERTFLSEAVEEIVLVVGGRGDVVDLADEGLRGEHPVLDLGGHAQEE